MTKAFGGEGKSSLGSAHTSLMYDEEYRRSPGQQDASKNQDHIGGPILEESDGGQTHVVGLPCPAGIGITHQGPGQNKRMAGNVSIFRY